MFQASIKFGENIESHAFIWERRILKQGPQSRKTAHFDIELY